VGGPHADVGSDWVLESLQFGQKHRLPQPLLRPCWRWGAIETQGSATWSILERLPERPQPLPPAPVEDHKLSPPAAAHGSSSGGKKPVKRKQTEPLGPGAKEQKREEAQRELRELMIAHFQADALVEVRGSEEGFVGSWYTARVMEAKEARSSVRLHLCYLAFQEDDGSLWEDWLDHNMVRPLPPEGQDDFVDGLKKGAALEVFIEEGWWEVEFVSRDGSNFVVESKRYKVQHTVQRSQLRPAWKWDDKGRRWGVLDKLPKEKGAAPKQSKAKAK